MSVVSGQALQPPSVEVAASRSGDGLSGDPVGCDRAVRGAASGTIILTIFPLVWLVLTVAAELGQTYSPSPVHISPWSP